MGRKKSNKATNRKKVTVKLLDREHAGKVTLPYQIMERLIEKHHPHLAEAKIAIAWRIGWKPNPDGYVNLGKCRKGSDLDRSLHGYDFVILLNKDRWPSLSPQQAEALVDHELMHAAVSVDANGEPKHDDLGRVVYRTRKHDLEEFNAVVQRHGIYKADIEAFCRSAAEEADRPLLVAAAEHDAGREEIAAEVEAGRESSVEGGEPEKPSTLDPGPSTASWSDVTLASLGINGRVAKALAEARPPITTVGNLSARMQAGDFWAADIRGLGPAGRKEIEDAMERFWGEHPEFVEAAASTT